jgi:hypothetical protein
LLFPDITIAHPFAINHAVEIGTRLLHDDRFYQDIVCYADEYLESFTHDAMRKKLLQALNL